MKSADEIVRALQNYASDCGADEACFQCTVAWMCDELGGNAPKIIANTVERLQSKLAAYEDTGLAPDEIPRWIDAESETPEIGQRVLLYFPDKEDDIRAGKYLGDGDYRIGMKVYRGYEIDAWMPLPQIPETENGK